MGGERAIETGIQKLSGTFKKDHVILLTGTVKSVDADKATCVVVIENDVELTDVQLQSAICDGLLITPVIDSMVTVITSTYGLPFVAQYSDIDEFYLQVNDSSLTVKNDGNIQLNDGSFKGLVKIEELVKKINALEKLVNNFGTAFNSHLHTCAAPGSPSTAPTVPFTEQINPVTQVSDLENDKITHGK